MVQIKPLLIGTSLYLVGQLITYYQLNGQFIWPWFKKNPFYLSLLGLVISFIFILATKYSVEGFNGLMWPQRFIGFATGMVIYAWGTGYYFDQPIDLKTSISLLLSFVLICIQILWK
jgi:hypothetical protein